MAARIAGAWPPPGTWGQHLAGWLVCSWRGHQFMPKMTGRVCRRCRIYVGPWPP